MKSRGSNKSRVSAATVAVITTKETLEYRFAVFVYPVDPRINLSYGTKIRPSDCSSELKICSNEPNGGKAQQLAMERVADNHSPTHSLILVSVSTNLLSSSCNP